MSAEDAAECRTCAYVWFYGRDEDPAHVPQYGTFQCRRRAPERRLTPDHLRDKPVWPDVDGDHWCGDYRRRPEIP